MEHESESAFVLICGTATVPPLLETADLSVFVLSGHKAVIHIQNQMCTVSE